MSNTDTVSIQGYAVLWGVKYNMGEYVEEVARGALDQADMSNVKMLVDHNYSLLLASVGGKTLRLKIDSKGLFFSADLPSTSVGLYTAEMISRQDLTQTSWGFSLDIKTGSEWSQLPNGNAHRVITNVRKVYDVSVVTFPANPYTSVQLV